MKIFLGGTCGNSKWRDEVIPRLEKLGIDYFNPVVDDWTPAAQEEEVRQKSICDYVLYVITPEMSGVYSIAEVVDDSNKRPQETIFCVLSEDNGKRFSKSQVVSLNEVSKLVKHNGAWVFFNIDSTIRFLAVISNFPNIDSNTKAKYNFCAPWME